jgi:hypothetical protein
LSVEVLRATNPVLATSALAVITTGPTTGSTLTLFQLLFRPADAARSGGRLFGVLDPTDEFITRERCDILPRLKGPGVGDQFAAQVSGKLVHDATG